MRKKRNIYFVNTVNIENTLNAVNTANNKNNILFYLILPMDCSLPVESTPQIHFENASDKDVDETSRKSYVDYYPAGNYMFKVNNRNTRTRCEICSMLTIKTPERTFWCLYC